MIFISPVKRLFKIKENLKLKLTRGISNPLGNLKACASIMVRPFPGTSLMVCMLYCAIAFTTPILFASIRTYQVGFKESEILCFEKVASFVAENFLNLGWQLNYSDSIPTTAFFNPSEFTVITSIPFLNPEATINMAFP